MSSSLAFRHVRHLSTAAAASAAAAKPVTISHTKSRLKKVHDPDEALKIYYSFTTSNDPSTSPSSIRHAQEFTVRRLAKSQRFSDIETFLESHKSNPQITHEPFISSLIRSYGVAGMFENALKTYNEMTDFGTPRTTLSFNSFLYACIHSKAFDRVPTYFSEFPEKFGFSPDKFSYGILIKSYCEMGSPEIAIEKLNEMEEKGIDVDAIAFSTILHAFYEKGRSDEAEIFWDEMVTKKGLKPDVGSYNVRLLHIHHGEPEGIKKLIEEMGNVGIKPDVFSYNYMMTSYCEKGMMDEAKKVYNELLKTKGCNPNAATFRTLVVYMCKHGRFVSGYKVFKEGVKVGKIPDYDTLKNLLEGLVKIERMSEAKALVRTMHKRLSSNLLEAWGKLAQDLGVAHVGTQEVVDSGEIEKAVVTSEVEKANT
ncbi:hypothetical protein ACJIZ3_002250 [Penstemon smallii]|uniref:Pentatricopeptide repeat-containing protein n=1 Tax=Penstemon smallii TaxID=265156 RepID=A0ABD3U5Y9_9LAMI